MAIRDRGKIKWRPASFIPLAFEMQRSMYKDQERQPKPLIYENQVEEFDQRICYAMQNNHTIDPITKEIRFEVNPGNTERIGFEDIIGLFVID